MNHVLKPLPPAISRSERIGKIIGEMAREDFAGLTRRAIAKRAKVSEPLVTHYYGKIEHIRNSIMTNAVAARDMVIVAQGVGVRDPIAMGAPLELRKKAAEILAGVASE